MHIYKTLAATALAVAGASTIASAATLVDEDFTTNLGVFTAVESGGGVVSVTGGQAVFTDNNPTEFGFPRLETVFDDTLISSTSTGNNQLSGSFDIVFARDIFTPDLQVLINDGATFASPNSALNVFISDSFVRVRDATGNVFVTDSGGMNLDLAAGTPYRFAFDFDLSSDTQDTFDLRVIDLSTDTEIGSLLNRDSFLANGTPDTFVFNAGTQAPAETDPFVSVDNVFLEVTPIPEPTSVFAVTLLGVLGLKRRR
ncbi:MAG: hypothetical protein AAF743_07565 [Planctomycetota bacterium]